NGVLLRTLPFKDPQKLVMVWGSNYRLGYMQFPVSAADFVDWRDQNHVFEQFAALQSQDFNLTSEAEPERIGGVRVSASFFPLLGVNTTLGRTFLPEEDQADAGKVVVISNGLWQRRFGSDPKLIGQSITLNGESYTVI